jgi:hypothetical protein
MRFAPSIAPMKTNTEPRQVKGLSAAYGVKRIHTEEPAVLASSAQQEESHALLPSLPQFSNFEDRRKVCRRVNHLPVLIELRSGVERRRRNLLDGDATEHVDETV